LRQHPGRFVFVPAALSILKENTMKTLILKNLKPRNPLVRASLMRKAGAHRPSGGALRRKAQLALRLEFEHLPQRRP
jgi:hypothetical protein